MNLIILTSSRADYGIYLPLLKKLKREPYFTFKIVAFGTHLSEKYGNTINQIYQDGFEVSYKIKTVLDTDSPESISKSMATTIDIFAELWNKEKSWIDYIICLGDRYEMFAAVASSIPFNIPIAHIHGGETTLGAIDNSFRHSLTTMSKLHFTSTEGHAKRVSQLRGTAEGVYNVGALSLDNLNDIKLLDHESFKTKFNIDIVNPILVTFHPETIAFEKNDEFVSELIEALDTCNQQIIITMPNSDTMGNVIRVKLIEFANRKSNVIIVESLGTIGYFSCLQHCDFVLGNSSSGIIEAASFGKYVINIGSRQLGRDAGENVIHCDIEKSAMLNAMQSIQKLPSLNKNNIYGDGFTADKIVTVLKSQKTI